MIKLADALVESLDFLHYGCNQCGEPFGTTDDPDVEGAWDCVVGKDNQIYHSGCCIEAGEE